MTSDTQFFKMLGRMIRAGAKRAGNGDEIELNQFCELKSIFDLEITNAVNMQLENGKSFSDIGFSMGISRQAAHRKYKQL